MSFGRQSFGLVGSLFVSACCLGAGPILAALAAAFGFSAFHSVLNIYVLAPLMTVSVLWMVWNLGIQGRAVAGAVSRYAPFWIGLAGGALAWVGVILPHVATLRIRIRRTQSTKSVLFSDLTTKKVVFFQIIWEK